MIQYGREVENAGEIADDWWSEDPENPRGGFQRTSERSLGT